MWPRGIAHRGNARDQIWKLPWGNIESERLLPLVASSYIWTTFRENCVTVFATDRTQRDSVVPWSLFWDKIQNWTTPPRLAFYQRHNKETSSLQADISLVIHWGCSLCRVSQVVVAVFQDFFLTKSPSWNIVKFHLTNFGTTTPQEFDLLAFYQTPNVFIIGLS